MEYLSNSQISHFTRFIGLAGAHRHARNIEPYNFRPCCHKRAWDADGRAENEIDIQKMPVSRVASTLGHPIQPQRESWKEGGLGYVMGLVLVQSSLVSARCAGGFFMVCSLVPVLTYDAFLCVHTPSILTFSIVTMWLNSRVAFPCIFRPPGVLSRSSLFFALPPLTTQQSPTYVAPPK